MGNSFVPADSAELGITDKILTKINTQDSVSNVRQIHRYTRLPKLIPSQIQSTFMNDLQQISLSLKQARSQSLVIIDEFGKGTNECGSWFPLNILNQVDPSDRWHRSGMRDPRTPLEPR